MGLVTKYAGGVFPMSCGNRWSRCCRRDRPIRWAVTTRVYRNSAAMNAILLVLRTGMQWNALSATGVCSCSSAYRRFREWSDAGVFLRFWQQELLCYDALKGIDWDWLAMDGAMTKAPLGRGKNRPQPHRPRQMRCQAQPAHGWDRHPAGRGSGGCEPPRHEAGGANAGEHHDQAPLAQA